MMWQITRLIFLIVICLVSIVSITLVMSTAQGKHLAVVEPAETVEASIEIPAPEATLAEAGRTVATPKPEFEVPEYIPDPADVEILAKLAWGEARGVRSVTEQAAVIWTPLNRIDAGYGDTIYEVVTAENQFHGYLVNNPTTDDFSRDLTELAADVLTRWAREKQGIEDVGRVLPASFLWFEGDGERNYFYDVYHGGPAWDWSLPSPYES